MIVRPPASSAKETKVTPEWGGADDDIYVDLDVVRGGVDGVASTAWPAALRPHLTRPTAILARQVATPNYEMLWFTRLARRLGFHALIVEHSSDRFTVNNPTKLALIALPIVTGRSRDGQMIMRRQKMMEAPAPEGQRLDTIVFRSGERLLGNV
jgi:hypothetical protein